MAALSRKLRSSQDNGLLFQCPGCKELHVIRVGTGSGPRWSWNGDAEKPTFRPSVLVTWKEPSDNPDEFDDQSKDIDRVCHSWVTDGAIEFLTDSTHHLAGKTVEIPDLEEE